METKREKRIDLILVATVVLWFLSGGVSHGDRAVTTIGDAANLEAGRKASIPTLIELPMPASEAEKNSLGLSGTGNFPIAAIKTQVVIIEVLSFYCPHCQRMASTVNELYQKLQEQPDLKDKIKIIGIGVSNSAYEIDSFRERYHVPFPLFPDPSADISLKLGARGTPTFIGLKVTDRVSPQPFFFEEGGFQDAQQFLTEIVKLSGLK
jgi:thiol-disulfide isomerase/thioredoxin